MELVIGNANYSSWSLRPWLYADHHGLAVSITRMPLESPQLLGKLSNHFSRGRVPLLIDGETDIWESLSILEFLGERFDPDGWPTDPVARGVARSVSGEMHSGFSALRSEVPMNIRRRFPGYVLTEAALADVERICAVWRYCRERFGSGGPWLFGAFSIADAMYAPVVMRFRSVEVALDENARTYCETMHLEPSVQRWIEMAYAEPDVLAMDELEWDSEEIPRR